MKSKLNQKGMTLVELLVSIAILSLLMAILLPSITQTAHSVKQQATTVYTHSILDAIETYKSSWGNYPLTAGSRDFTLEQLYLALTEKTGRKGPYVTFGELDGTPYSSASQEQKDKVLFDRWENSVTTNYYVYDILIRYRGVDGVYDTADDLLEFWTTNLNSAIVKGTNETRLGVDGTTTTPHAPPNITNTSLPNYTPTGNRPKKRGRVEKIRFYSAGPDGEFGNDDDASAGN